MSSVLLHSRTPGSRNGERRWQNKDGTWTAEGKERRRAEYARDRRTAGYLPGSAGEGGARQKGRTIEFSKDEDGSYYYDPHHGAKKAAEAAFESGPKGKPSLAEKMVNEIDSIPGKGKQISRGAYALKRGKQKLDLSKMSDDDLRKAINRMNLERTYESYKASEKTKGEDKVNSILDIAGGVTGIASSATLVALGLYKIYKMANG